MRKTDFPDSIRLIPVRTNTRMPGKTWIIRPAQLPDTDALTRCIDGAYAIYADRITDLPAVSDGVGHDIEIHRVWVAELEGSVIGGLILIPHDGYAVLANVAVDPASSGLGVGRGLIECAEAACRSLGLQELRLSTHSEMPENVELYEHLGWKKSSRSGNKIHMIKVI